MVNWARSWSTLKNLNTCPFQRNGKAVSAIRAEWLLQFMTVLLIGFRSVEIYWAGVATPM